MTDEIRPDANPKTQYGMRKPSLALIPPTALVQEGVVFGFGAQKYGPYNWRDTSVSARVYVDAAMRHLLTWWDGEHTDPESGASHLAHARACLGIILDAQAVGMLIDDRPPLPGATASLIRRFTSAALAVDPDLEKRAATVASDLTGQLGPVGATASAGGDPEPAAAILNNGDPAQAGTGSILVTGSGTAGAEVDAATLNTSGGTAVPLTSGGTGDDQQGDPFTQASSTTDSAGSSTGSLTSAG